MKLLIGICTLAALLLITYLSFKPASLEIVATTESKMQPDKKLLTSSNDKIEEGNDENFGSDDDIVAIPIPGSVESENNIERKADSFVEAWEIEAELGRVKSEIASLGGELRLNDMELDEHTRQSLGRLISLDLELEEKLIKIGLAKLNQEIEEYRLNQEHILADLQETIRQINEQE